MGTESKAAQNFESEAEASRLPSAHGFTGYREKLSRCHPESPLGVRDLHLPSPLPFPQFEISNLKFEISVAFELRQ
jgi:hypothetical protein